MQSRTLGDRHVETKFIRAAEQLPFGFHDLTPEAARAASRLADPVLARVMRILRNMSRFVIEHLPRNPARYLVRPLEYAQAEEWIESSEFHSLVRTTELIAAMSAGMAITLSQSDLSMQPLPIHIRDQIHARASVDERQIVQRRQVVRHLQFRAVGFTFFGAVEEVGQVDRRGEAA